MIESHYSYDDIYINRLAMSASKRDYSYVFDTCQLPVMGARVYESTMPSKFAPSRHFWHSDDDFRGGCGIAAFNLFNMTAAHIQRDKLGFLTDVTQDRSGLRSSCSNHTSRASALR